MTNIHNEDQSIDWEKVKEFVCSLAATLDEIVKQLPQGIVKTILLAVLTLLHLACNNISE